MKARELASFLNAPIIGDPEKEVTKVGYIHTAKNDELAYCYLNDYAKDLDLIGKTDAGVVICHKHLKNKLKQMKVKATLIFSEAPRYDFGKILQTFFVKEIPAISPLAYVGENVKIGEDVSIHPGAVVQDNTVIGNRVTVRANAVLGAEGMNYGRNKNGKLQRVPHLGGLILEDDVDIGCLTIVQQGTLKPTVIGEDSKIGPNCDIGHGSIIGKHCLITGMNFIGGSVEIGDYVYVGPHSTIKDGVKIGSNVFVGIGSLVLRDVPSGLTVVGRPAIELGKFKEERKRLKKLLRMKTKC